MDIGYYSSMTQKKRYNINAPIKYPGFAHPIGPDLVRIHHTRDTPEENEFNRVLNEQLERHRRIR